MNRNPKHLSREFGGTLPKVLLLVVFFGLLVGFILWKQNEGVIGHQEPLPDSTATTIAFIRRDGKLTSLVLIKSDGTGEKTLINDEKNRQSLCWSPDGKQLCYSAEVSEEKGRANQLFIHGGGGSRQLTQGSVSKDYPQWRPNGQEIAFLTGGKVKIVKPNGEGMEQIYPPAHKGGGGNEDTQSENDGDEMKSPPMQSFRWSPDGAGIAGVQITEGEQAAAIGQGRWWDKQKGDSATQSLSQVMEPESLVLLPGLSARPEYIPGTNCKELSFDWLPDSKRVAVAISTRGARHGIGLFRTDEVRIAPTGILSSTGYTIAPKSIVVSPDGSQVAFEVYRMSSPEDSSLMGIAVVSTDPASALNIATPADIDKLKLIVKGSIHSPQWSPDSKKLLYTTPNATNSGDDIWVVNADGSQPVNLTKGKGSNSDAVWSPAK